MSYINLLPNDLLIQHGNNQMQYVEKLNSKYEVKAQNVMTGIKDKI